ncbi:MAG: LacI family DNA-binding transcriptional regulator [Actinobacteria bacterium]|nr:LacI family DNA-binding transcriptional regulator [Actinomycetota bacterium]
MAKAITLKDVAREAGVHISTASRALNEETRSGLSAETADRVIATAERLGYQPHPLARGLRTNRTRSVGMVVPDLISPFIPPILAGAQHTLSEVGYSLLIGSDDESSPRTRPAVETFLERRVDGLIVANAHLEFTPPDAVQRREVPTVLVSRCVADGSFPAIVGDDQAALSLVVRHLVELGHTRIAHVAGPLDISTGLFRRDGFINALAEEGLAASDCRVFEAGSFHSEDGHAACSRLLDSGDGYTAIVAANDLLALGCIDAIQERGLSVPRDLSVTGYDDIALVDRLDPALTTISLPYEEMGVVAGRLLLDLLASDVETVETPHEPKRLAPTLFVRSSTGSVGST